MELFSDENEIKKVKPSTFKNPYHLLLEKAKQFEDQSIDVELEMNKNKNLTKEERKKIISAMLINNK